MSTATPSQSRGRDRPHGGLLVIDGDAAARCGISMKGVDIVVKGSVGHMSAFMAQAGRLVVLRRRRRGARGLDLRGAALRARRGAQPRRRLRREADATTSTRRRTAPSCSTAAGHQRRGRCQDFRRYGSAPQALPFPRRQRRSILMTPPGPHRIPHARRASRPLSTTHVDRRDPARGRDRHLRHPRRRRQAQAAALRRPACSSARRISRYPLEGYREKLRDRRDLGTRFANKPIQLKIPITIAGMSFGALSAQAKEALGRGASAVGTSHDHRRRRHDPRRARAFQHSRLPGACPRATA